MTPTSSPVGPALTLQDKGDISHLLAAGGERGQALPGFAAQFTDIVQYIIKITHDIWEGQGIGLIYDYYAHNCPVHTAEGVIYGREAVMAGTIAALAAFPDRRLYGDEVIWGEEETGVFYTSHRLTHMGRNSGHSSFGPPTGRQVRYTAIADCVVRENRIVEEWLARDNLTLVRQLGFDPLALARTLAAAEAATGLRVEAPGEIERARGQEPPLPLPPAAATFEIEPFIRGCLHEVWNWRLLNKVATYYAPHYVGELPSGRRLAGRGDLRAFVLSMLAALPNAALQVQHVCALAEGPEAYRTATRWLLQGDHTGYGIYGAPTGKRVTILGMSHHLVRAGQIVQEWTVFDEFAVLKRLFTSDS